MYERKVVYLFQYHGNTAGKNVGYIKWNRSQEEGKLILNIKGLHLTKDMIGECSILLEKKKIRLGKVYLKNAVAEGKYFIDSELCKKMAERDISPDGVLVEFGDARCAAVFSSKALDLDSYSYAEVPENSMREQADPIRVSSDLARAPGGPVREQEDLIRIPDVSVNTENISADEPEVQTESVQTEEAEMQTEDAGQTQPPIGQELDQMTEPIREIEQLEVETEVPEAAGQCRPQADTEGGDLKIRNAGIQVETAAQTEPKSERPSVFCADINMKQPEQRRSANTGNMGIATNSGRTRRGEKRMQQEEPDNEDIFARLKELFPSVHPFEKVENKEYLSITPREIEFFKKEYITLVNNSFLLHGYQNYKYLILGRDLDLDVYTIGVPGVYYEKEEMMAKMFGFDKFLPALNGEVAQGSFGYYTKVLG